MAGKNRRINRYFVKSMIALVSLAAVTAVGCDPGGNGNSGLAYEVCAQIPDSTDLSAGGSYDFGDQHIGFGESMTFEIYNVGGVGFTVNSVAVNTGTEDGFSVVFNGPVTVAPVERTEFQIDFAPFNAAAYEASVDIAIENESTVTFGVKGNGVTFHALPSVTVDNLIDGGDLETGFLKGTASDHTDNPISMVEVSLDGGAYQTATGTASWSFQLPAGSGSWELGSEHTIDVRAKDTSYHYSNVSSFTVTKGMNKDTDGDGYVDLVIGSYGYDTGTGLISVCPGQTSQQMPAYSYALFGASGDRFGCSLVLGDFNGDGYADLTVGAYGYDPGSASNTGRVYVYYGSSSGLQETGSDVLDSGSAQDSYFGWTVSAADIDNDGYADLAVGAWGASQVFLYHGSAAGLSSSPDSTLSRPLIEMFGQDMAFGDVNNDGYADLVVSAEGYDPGSAAGTGRVYIYHGAGSGISGSADAALTGASGGDFFGNAVAWGDGNGDGYDDLVVGAEGYNSFTGQAYIFYADSGGTGITDGASPDTTLTGENTGDEFGTSLALGDIDGDDNVELVVGADKYDAGTDTDAGRIYLFGGSASGIVGTSPVHIDGSAADENFGMFLLIRDANADGYRDLLVGAPNYDRHTITDAGLARMYAGSAAGLVTGRDWEGSHYDQWLGAAADF